MRGLACALRPTQLFQREQVESQEDAKNAGIIIKVPEIDHASGDGLEAGAGAEKLEKLARLIAEPEKS